MSGPVAAARPTGTSPAEESQGSLGAVLVGAAILLIAGLLIFWPASDSATGGPGRRGDGSAQQANNNSGGGFRGGGLASGIAPREVDPAMARGTPGVRAGLLPPDKGLAMMPRQKPEPTGFSSAAAEITYFEKKLVEARANLEARTTFRERMKRIQDTAPVSQTEVNLRRAKTVEENFNKAKARVEELEKKLEGLRKKQAGG